MRMFAVLFVSVVLAALTAGASFAETIYVGDRLIVGIREIPETSAPSIGSLRSDDAVELLEEGDVFFKIRLKNGTEGYIKKQYLTKNRPKGLIIADLEKQLARQKQAVADLKANMSGSQSELQAKQAEQQKEIVTLKAEQQKEIDNLKAKLAESDRQLTETNTQLDTARKELENAQQDYQTLQTDAADVVSVVKAREALKKENERLTDELNTMREDSLMLLTAFYIKWFLAGAGVMFVGWMIGKSSRRKRRY